MYFEVFFKCGIMCEENWVIVIFFGWLFVWFVNLSCVGVFVGLFDGLVYCWVYEYWGNFVIVFLMVWFWNVFFFVYFYVWIWFFCEIGEYFFEFIVFWLEVVYGIWFCYYVGSLFEEIIEIYVMIRWNVVEIVIVDKD